MDKTVRINLIWVIGLLLLAICALLLRIPDGKYVADYISFAASLASLILAVVAIFYSIISNQSFYQSISKLTNLADAIQGSSSKIDATSETFILRAEQLLDEVKRVPSSVETLGTKLEERLADALSSRDTNDRPTEDETGYRPFLGPVTVGGGIALYGVALAARYSKPLDVADALESTPIRNYVAGFITSLAITKFRGLDIAFSEMKFEVRSPGELDVEAVIQRAETREDKIWVNARTQLKAFFDKDSDEE